MTTLATMRGCPWRGRRPKGGLHDAGRRFPGLSASQGFTIIEIIVTITIAAILGTIAIQFSGTSLSMSASTVNRIQGSYALNEIMEKITRDYTDWVADSSNRNAPISDFKAEIQADSEYSPYIDAAKTGTGSAYFLDNTPITGDVTIDLLHLTLTDGTQSLVAVFTK